MRDARIANSRLTIVYDDFDNPLMLAVEYKPGAIIASKLGDPDFHTLLQQLGLDRTVVLQNIQQQPLSQIAIP